MNEPSNSCKNATGAYIGECPPTEAAESSQTLSDKSVLCDKDQLGFTVGEFDNLQFSPGSEPLYTRTISMDAYHYDADKNGTFVQYNTHSLFGTTETMATNTCVKSILNRRPLIISRDSFVGHGVFGSVWTGDNKATQEDLMLSINQVMNFNMFGIPFTGGDI